MRQVLCKQKALTEVEVIRRQVRRGVTTWWFKATTPPDQDVQPVLTLDSKGQQLELWARLAQSGRKTLVGCGVARGTAAATAAGATANWQGWA